MSTLVFIFIHTYMKAVIGTLDEKRGSSPTVVVGVQARFSALSICAHASFQLSRMDIMDNLLLIYTRYTSTAYL